MRKAVTVAALTVSTFLSSALTVSAQTSQPIDVNTLLQQVGFLQQQLQSAQGNSSSLPAAAGGGCLTISRSLSIGASGSDVSSLQTFLRSTGDYTYPEITGYFGAVTQAAVQKWQARKGLVSSGSPETTGYGVIGPRTRALIQSTSCSTPYTSPITNPTGQLPCTINGAQIQSGTSLQLFSKTAAPTGESCGPYAQTRQCVNGTFSGSSDYQYVSCSSAAPASTPTQGSGAQCTTGDNYKIADGITRVFYSHTSVSSNDSCTAYSQSRTCNNGTFTGSATYAYLGCSASGAPSGCSIDSVTLQEGQSRTFYKQNSVLFGQTCTPFGKTRSCASNVLGGDVDYKYANCTVATAGSCTVGTTTVAHAQSRDFYSRASVSYQELCDTYKQSRTCTDGIISGGSSYQYPTCTQIPALTCTLDGVEVAHNTSYTFFTATVSSVCASIGQSRTCTNGVLSGTSQYKYGACAPTGQRWCKQDNVYVAHNASRTFYTTSSAPFGQSCTGQSRTCSDGVLQGSSTYSYATCATTPAASCTLDGQTVAHGQSYGFYSRQTVSTTDTCDAYKQIRACFDGTLSGSTSFKFSTCATSTTAMIQQANLASVLIGLESALRALLAKLGGSASN